MTLAAHTNTGKPGLPAASQRDVSGLSLMLVNGAMQNVDVARTCLERGHDPRRHLRAAALRIRELPATLPLSPSDPLAVNFADVCEYICRRLRTLGDEHGLPALDEVCDLLREICRAWVTLPMAGVTLYGQTPLAAHP